MAALMMKMMVVMKTKMMCHLYSPGADPEELLLKVLPLKTHKQ